MRIIGIDDSPFNKFKDRNTLVIGTIYRGGSYMDGLISTTIVIDGNNATRKIADMINKSKFKSQLKLIMLDGIAVGGFNVIDIQELHNLTKIPVIVVMRDLPRTDRIFNTLEKLGMNKKIDIIKKAGSIYPIDRLYVQVAGIGLYDAGELLKLTCVRSLVPEPIRMAHIIASGIKFGESRGRA